jgi:hypothetical protein
MFYSKFLHFIFINFVLSLLTTINIIFIIYDFYSLNIFLYNFLLWFLLKIFHIYF